MEFIKFVAKSNKIFVNPHILSLFLNLFNKFNTTFKSIRVGYQFSLFLIKIYVMGTEKNQFVLQDKIPEKLFGIAFHVIFIHFIKKKT